MLLHRGTIKRILCVLMACVWMLAPVTPASAATARATTMKLEKKEGTVTLKTQSGTSLHITDGMRLYNGNSLATGTYSYAYISLDSSKAVKLDQSSSATLRQNGRSLELLVRSGKLFFNVDKPLGQDESMNVRTSTMVTGIRGTCGVVEFISKTQSRLYLIEGEVTLGTGDQAVVVKGGQAATVYMGLGSGTPIKPGDADPDAKQMVQVEKMAEKDIPAVALDEIMGDSSLQKKIEQTTELDMEKIREAHEQFKREEAERDNPGKTDQDQKDDRKEDPQNDDHTPGSSSGGSSSGGSSGGSSTPSQSVEKEINLTGIVTSGAIEAAFAQRDKVHIGYGTGDAELQLGTGESLTIPAGKELLIWGKQKIPSKSKMKVEKGGLLCVPEGAALGGEGSVYLTAGSTLEVHGTLGTDLNSNGGATIKNTNTIRGNYVAAKADEYQGDSGVLISAEPLDSLSQDDWLLMTSVAISDNSEDQNYYYAKYICKAVVEAIAALSGDSVSWNFAANAVIPAGDVVSLSNFHVQMNDKELWIEGSLTLEGNTEIVGTGQRVVHLNGGTLKLGGSDEGSIENQNGGYAVSYGAGSLIWSNKNVKLVVDAPGMDSGAAVNKYLPYTLQGIQIDAQTSEITKPDYVTIAENGQLAAAKGESAVLQLIEGNAN